ncbi:MAG TPA: DNA topoisomerase VI subunit B [Pirellulaceae bacterium]|nr:DNA topoisomerase VI subunit B [Pirellulaceae bacterium]HMP69300.1 DNA topoisomerase VI subunit B [Pirellulaceae bacterium]
MTTEAPPRRKRATAESMAAEQRSISVSEFFTKNRHLLGFDNPRKALLTTVKEAVDNSLDACEEAGIVPTLWVAIEAAGKNRFRVAVQDNGPGIVKKQIPLIFGKLLYGSKFHRLRMSRGQQGIGISAAGMYGQLTTGKPVRIVSKIGKNKPAHYFEIQINTKTNHPEILNGKGEGEDIPAGDKGIEYCNKYGITWVAEIPPLEEGGKPEMLVSGTRVTIEMEAGYKRGKGSVDEYLEQTAIANPHVTIYYSDPDGNLKTYVRSTTTLPPEAKEIKPHPYGVELGRLLAMIKDDKGPSTISQFLTNNFSRVSSAVARRICEAAKISTRASTKKIGRNDVDKLFEAIQNTKISPPETNCIAPISEELLLKGLYQVVPGEFYAAATRPPAVYRGNPFQIEVALAYGGAMATKKVGKEELNQLLSESDARNIKKFLITTFDGMGPDGADKIVKASGLSPRMAPAKMKSAEREALLEAMQGVAIGEGQTMQILRYANRVPLQFKMGDCAITKTVMSTNWRSYGLSQSRGSLPSGPVTIMVHMASVWVPFTSESKEAIASYDEIEKELRLALQAVGRKLGMFLRRRITIRQENERRSIFLRYLGEVASAVNEINGTNRDSLYDNLLKVAQRKTKEADTKLDTRGKRIEDDSELYGDNVIIVEPQSILDEVQVKSNGAATANGGASKKGKVQKELF